LLLHACWFILSYDKIKKIKIKLLNITRFVIQVTSFVIKLGMTQIDPRIYHLNIYKQRLEWCCLKYFSLVKPSFDQLGQPGQTLTRFDLKLGLGRLYIHTLSRAGFGSTFKKFLTTTCKRYIIFIFFNTFTSIPFFIFNKRDTFFIFISNHQFFYIYSYCFLFILNKEHRKNLYFSGVKKLIRK